MAKLYFVDGYHGGIRGHMPEGSFQNIMYAMETWPEWKISLEIESESWEYIRRHDPATYQKLQAFIAEHTATGRVEFISGSYAQPFCWAVNGESNVRQLIHGAEVLKRHFPEVVIDTYAVQEPCFTSMLPQICAQLGYLRISLKNPTAWGGYMAKMPGEIVNLQSGDGSSLPAVPRYECEELVSCSATEAAGYDYTAISRFADKCIKNGISAPAGMCLQDLGWQAKPLVRDIDVEYITWREYFNRFGSRCKENIIFSQEDILVALPWGNQIFQRMLRVIRRQENRILQVEKLLAIAEAETGVESAEGRQLLTKAWESLMHAQHHDGYICATTRSGTKQWAFRSTALAEGCRLALEEVSDIAMEALTAAPKDVRKKENDIWLRVYSTAGSPRVSQAEVLLGLDHGCRSFRVYSHDGEEIPAQFTPARSYEDGTIGAAVLRFDAALKGVGYTTVRVVPSGESTVQDGKKLARKTIQDTVELDTGYYHLVFDLTKGGSIVRFFDRETRRDYAAGIDGFGAIRGFKISENRFISNAAVRVNYEDAENGPLYARLIFSGSFNGIEFRNEVSVCNNSRRIDFVTSAVFKEETDIGYPYTPSPEERYYGVKRSSCREDYKLGIQFPPGPLSNRIMKSAPYDVYESRLKDTRFDSWDSIRHNIINGYIDFYDERSDTGFAVFCDQVNGYSLADQCFALTMGFGYHGNFWWGYQPLKGACEIGYSLMAHPGNWEKGLLPYEDSLLRDSLLVQRLPEKPECTESSIFSCGNKSVETVTILRDRKGFKVRLFHAASQEEPLDIIHAIPGLAGLPVQLNDQPSGKPADRIGKLEIRTIQ